MKSTVYLKSAMYEGLLTTKEAAKFLRVSPIHMYKLTRQGQVPVVRRERRYTRYYKNGLDVFLNRCIVQKGGKNESSTIYKSKH